MELSLEPIGEVTSCYPDKFGTPRQPGLVPQSKAFISLYGHYQPKDSLAGLTEFSHLWILFWFHKNSNARFHAKVHPPRLGGGSTGVFATRSPHRPNPVGLSLVKLLSVEKDGIWVGGIDFISGTPVLDIKPYLPEVEALPEARAGWTAGLQGQTMEFDWDPQCLADLLDWEKKSKHIELRELIEKTLSLDPRPLVYKGFESDGTGTSTYRSEHAVRFFNGDVHFKFLATDKIKILRISYE